MTLRILPAWIAAGCLLLAYQLRPEETSPAATGAVRAETRAEAGARRYALLIGINDYTASTLGTGKPGVRGRGWHNLYGAVNDVESMREMLMLSRYGFADADIRMLKNQSATRAAIISALEILEGIVRRGDIVLFYYSGHGSQVLNSKSSEPDKLDESIVPADSRLGVDDIRDKALRRHFNRILDRGARLTVILDSCHSGSGARDLVPDRVRTVRPDTRDVADGTSVGPRPEDRGALVISASQDRERAGETTDDRGRRRGAFSWAWLRAMRLAAPGERAMDTFLRAQALVRADAAQDPVLAGTADARATPFLSTTRAAAAASRLAVEEVRSDGTIVVQGGWAHGLTVGSELRLLGGDGGNVRLEVKEMLGLGRCEAQLAAPRAAPEELIPGALLEVAGWASPPARPLRVWMPSVTSTEAAVAWVEELAREASVKGVRWIDDPVEQPPTHLLQWGANAWELVDDVERLHFTGSATARDVLATIPARSSLFVHLPAPSWLIQGIAIGRGTARAAIEPTNNPEQADYILTGRFTNRAVDYAWVRPGLVTSAAAHPVLPLRTKWQSASVGSDLSLVLQDAVVRLRRIHAWQLLESPPGGHSAYALELRRRTDGTPVRDHVLVGKERYLFALRARPGAAPKPRYMYVFLIDSHGTGVLFYPTADTGSVENMVPLDRRTPAPTEIVLDGGVRAIEPYGIDTYFLLTTDDALPDPTILQWDGVRGRAPASTALEELLMQTGSVTRSGETPRTPANWSIERVVCKSVPPVAEGSS